MEEFDRSKEIQYMRRKFTGKSPQTQASCQSKVQIIRKLHAEGNAKDKAFGYMPYRYNKSLKTNVGWIILNLVKSISILAIGIIKWATNHLEVKLQLYGKDKKHKASVLNSSERIELERGNYQEGEHPLERRWEEKSIVYQATGNYWSETNVYYDLIARTFINR